jgi:hypothetical protein
MIYDNNDVLKILCFLVAENIHLEALVISTNVEFGCGKNILDGPEGDMP